MWMLKRKRGLMLVAMTMGMSFAATNCIDEAQLTLLRGGFSSWTLPINQSILTFFGFLNNAIVGAATGS